MAARRKFTKYLFIHSLGTDDALTIFQIARQHRAQGMLECGYHFVVHRDGTVGHGRHIEECGNHIPGYNHESVGVCVVAARPASRTPEQIEALGKLCDALEERYPGIAIRQVD